MKKLNAKFIASSAMAVVIASVMAVSAGALPNYDATSTPEYTPVDVSKYLPTLFPGVSTGSSASTTPATSDKPAADSSAEKIVVTGSAIGDTPIKEAIATGKPIEVTPGSDGKVIITEAGVGEIVKGKKPITFIVKDGDGTHTVVIDPSEIKEVTEIDLAAKAHATAAPDEVDDETPGDVDAELDVDDTGLDIDDADDDGEVIDDVTIDEPSTTTGKDDTSVVVDAGGTDANPVTGTTLALGSLAVFAAAAVATSKKRK